MTRSMSFNGFPSSLSLICMEFGSIPSSFLTCLHLGLPAVQPTPTTSTAVLVQQLTLIGSQNIEGYDLAREESMEIVRDMLVEAKSASDRRGMNYYRDPAAVMLLQEAVIMLSEVVERQEARLKELENWRTS